MISTSPRCRAASAAKRIIKTAATEKIRCDQRADAMGIAEIRERDLILIGPALSRDDRRNSALNGLARDVDRNRIDRKINNDIRTRLVVERLDVVIKRAALAQI